jgi:acyl dehydratase
VTGLADAYARLLDVVGARGPAQRGEIGVAAIERFARASGETDPVYFYDEAALAGGFTGRPAPPLMLSSVFDWYGGPALDELRADGSGGGKESWLPLDGLRLMGGGQAIDLARPVVAGDSFVATPELAGVEHKQGGSGELLLLRITTTFLDGGGRLLATCDETLIGR